MQRSLMLPAGDTNRPYYCESDETRECGFCVASVANRRLAASCIHDLTNVNGGQETAGHSLRLLTVFVIALRFA